MPKQATIDYILEKVAPLFNSRGYIGTSLSDLTEATQLSKGAIYGNFASKEELAFQCFKYNAKKILAPLKEVIEEAPNAYEKLLSIINYHRTYSKRIHAIGGCPILNVGIDAKHINPKLYEMAKTVSRRIIKDIEEILELGAEDHSIKKVTDPQRLAKTIFSVIDGGIVLAMTHEDDSYLQNMLDHLEEQIIKPIKSK